ncbi:MAG: hypothetical protein JNJ64_07910 [Flavobacteriales bacterium]|nr:hypothetical protein [Flavobacteriales bacterium]
MRDANSIIEEQLDDHLKAIEQTLDADLITYFGPISRRVDDSIREALESRENKRNRLAVIIETGGGLIDVAQRIAYTMRKHYDYIYFIVPNYSMSAGTLLALSGNEILMDYYSVLGPIDPQFQNDRGMMIPALGYLVQYDRLLNKSKNGKLTTAELTILIEKFDPAELYHYEQARELSISLLKDWLVKYKFKNWTRTQTKKKSVNQIMKRRRAEFVARILNDTERWHSHGHGISMEVLRRDVKLQIRDFGLEPQLNGEIRIYYRLLSDYMSKLGHIGITHIPGRYAPIFVRTR